jgi:hypothetical protein
MVDSYGFVVNFDVSNDSDNQFRTEDLLWDRDC